MRIASQGDFWVCVSELSLQSLGICTERIQLSRVTVTEAMETDFRQPESLLEGLQLPPSPVGEIDGLSIASRKHIVAVLTVFRFATQFQKSIAEFLRQGKWFVSCLAFEATLLPVPHRLLWSNLSRQKINILPLQSVYFATPQTCEIRTQDQGLRCSVVPERIQNRQDIFGPQSIAFLFLHASATPHRQRDSL